MSGAIALLLVLTPGRIAAQERSGVPHTAELSSPRLDVLENGETIVTLAAAGELKGLVTFKLRRANDGRLSGEWAFTVAHADSADPETGFEPEPEHAHGDRDHDHPHRDYVTLVHRGTLAGTVSEAELTFDSDHNLVHVSATLTIAQGSSEFEGATGTGQATLNTLSLFF